jgi:AcrR family transcriptional regulator
MSCNNRRVTITDSPGLRERKRRATRRAIQLAVLKLAAERGLEHVTIEEVSRIADISPRTFFNYFVSKEAAIVGDSPELTDLDAIERFVHAGTGSDILSGIGELIASSADVTAEDHEAMFLRRALHKQEPQLFALRIANMHAFEDQLTATVARRLREDAPAEATGDDELESRARLITLIAFAAMRHAWTCWADADGTIDLPQRLRDSFAEIGTVLQASSPR